MKAELRERYQTEMNMQLKDVCTPEVICCAPSTSVLEAARLMRRHHVGDLVVVQDPEGDRLPLGVVTDRDLVVEVLGNDRDASTTTVKSLLTPRVVIAQETEDTSVVLERMKANGVRRVPIVDHAGRLTGIITFDDLLRLCVGDAAALLEVMTKGATHEKHLRR